MDASAKQGDLEQADVWLQQAERAGGSFEAMLALVFGWGWEWYRLR